MSWRGYGRRPRRKRVARIIWLFGFLSATALAFVAVRAALPDTTDNVTPSQAAASDCNAVGDCVTAPSLPSVDSVLIAPEPSPRPLAVLQAAPTILLEAAPPPSITGQAALLLEEPCGITLYELNPHQRLAPASLAKIATALVAVERSDLSSEVEIHIDGAALWLETGSTVMGLVPGQTLTMRDLLYGLLLPSGNDAALAIAEYISGDVDSFVRLMNKEARDLGLRNTRFQTPDGRDAKKQYTSAFDITILARALLREPQLAAIVSTDLYLPSWDGPEIWNTNPLLYDYPDSIGVKVGFTDQAKDVIIGAAERAGRRLLVTVLSSDDAYYDSVALLDWAFDSTPQVCGTAAGS